MPSGEDAEAAAAKLQARMRGKAARQEVADLKASQQVAAGEAEEQVEEEEMPSGEDAEAAAAKLQARMRGKAAREQVALQRLDLLDASAQPSESRAPHVSPPVSPERIQQMYQGRVERVNQELTEENSTSVELSEAGVGSASGGTAENKAASVARMQKIYKSRVGRALTDDSEGGGNSNDEQEPEASLEDDLTSRITGLYQRRRDRSEQEVQHFEHACRDALISLVCSTLSLSPTRRP